MQFFHIGDMLQLPDAAFQLLGLLRRVADSLHGTSGQGRGGGGGGPRRRRPRLEVLEPRHLLAVDFTELAKLLPTADAADTSHADDVFGISVAVDGDTAAAGTAEDDGASDAAGAAYVFSRVGDTWSVQQKLTAADAASRDNFGISEALSR